MKYRRCSYKQHFYKQHQAKLAKTQAKAKLHLELNFWCLKIISFIHPHYPLKIKLPIQKMCKKNKCVYFNEIIFLTTIKNENKK